MSDLKKAQQQLQNEAKEFLDATLILPLLGKLGEVTQTGSSVTGLMVYPDIDFDIQTDNPTFQDAVSLVRTFVDELKATEVKIADFRTESTNPASYYIGLKVPYKEKSWHLDVTIRPRGPITTNPPELSEWLENISEEERETILRLKKELIDAKRYVGARSQPPYTFRSIHLYEGVLKGHAQSIQELENYFNIQQ